MTSDAATSVGAVPLTHGELAAAVDQADPPTSPKDRVNRSVQLGELISQAVVATPGVVRVEPTLKNALLRITTSATTTMAGVLHGSDHDRPERYLAIDGVSVVVHNNYVDSSIDIVTDTTQPARRTAQLTQQRVEAVIRDAGLTPVTTAITVLWIEPPTTPA